MSAFSKSTTLLCLSRGISNDIIRIDTTIETKIEVGKIKFTFNIRCMWCTRTRINKSKEGREKKYKIDDKIKWQYY